MRRLYRGDFQPTLEAALLCEVAARKSDDPLQCCLVIVPSQLLKIHLRRLLAERGCSHLNLHFLSLVDLARALAEEQLGRQELSNLSGSGRRLLAREVAREAGPGSYFHEVRELAGFAAVLAETIRDVRDCLIAAESLRKAATGKKQRDFAELLLAYERRLTRARLVDDAALIQIALEAVDTHPLLDAAGSLLVYGFYDFTSAQRCLLEAVIRRSGAVVFAPIGEGPAFVYGQPTLEFLRALDFQPASMPLEETGAGSSLCQLRTRLFFRPDAGGPLASDGSVQILACPGEAQEAREVVHTLKQLAGELPLCEVGVVRRGTDGLALLDETLESYCRAAELTPDQRPPVFRQGGRPLLENRSARSLLMFLKLIQGGLRRAALFEWLHFSGHEPRAVALERLARRAGILGGGDPELWLRPLKRLSIESDRRPSSTQEQAAERRQSLQSLEQLILDLAELTRQLHGARSHVELTQLVSTAYRRLRSEPEEWLELFEALSLLDRLEIPVDLDTFIDAVETTLSEASEPQGAFQQGLLLGSLLPVRGLPFRALILPGMQDGVFPRQPSPDPILLDHERSELGRKLLPAGDVGLPLTRRARDEDRMLFRLALAAASERLILTYPRVDALTGNECIPSPLLLWLAESLLGRRLQMQELERLDFVRQVPIDGLAGAGGEAGREPLDLAEYDRVQLSRAAASGRAAAVHCLMHLQPTTQPALESELARWQRREFTAFDGVLSCRIARQVKQSAAQGPFSASRLEEYAGCPFRFFSRVVLGLREPEEPDELIPMDAGERGSLMHSILEQFFRELLEANEPFPLQESRAESLLLQLDAAARVQFDAFEQRLSPAQSFLWSSEQRRVLDDLHFSVEREIAAGSDRRPALLEVRFGQGGEHPALELVIDDRRVALSGTIDRVDLSADGRLATVIDYKTGESFAWDGDLQGGRRIQLPVYALALEQVIRKHCGTIADQTEYFFVTRKGRGVRPSAASQLWQGERESDLIPVLGRIVAGIEAGRFFADPSDAKLCKFCEFKLACGLGAGLEERFERKSQPSQDQP